MQDPAFHNRRTRKALDELADMLLTGPVPIPSPFLKDKREREPEHDAGAGHDPIEPASAGESLKLHREPVGRPSPVLEAVLLGNLPGFAAPWVTQYADMLSRISGSTALVKIADSSVELDLFGESAVLDAFRARHGEVGDFAEALAAVAECAAEYTMLVGSPETDLARRRLAEVDRWTVLSGANDQAIVGAYRLIKSLVVDASIPVPRRGIRLSFMGCDDDQAAAAAERITRASAAFLKTTITWAGSRKKMTAVRRLSVGRFDLGAGVDPWIVVHGFFQPPDRPLGAVAAGEDPGLLTAEEIDALAAFDDDAPLPETRERRPGAKTMRVDADVDPPFDVDADTPPNTDPVSEAAGADAPADSTPGEALADEHVIDHELEQRLIRSLEDNGPKKKPTPPPALPSQTPSAQPLEPVIAPAPSLASYLEGARAMEARCPHHPQVEIAADSSGRLLLAMNVSGAGSDTGAAIKALLRTRQWAGAHAALLALTDRDAAVNPMIDPLCHLFTDQPRAALELAIAGLTEGQPIRLHLLKAIAIDGRTTFIHEPLS